MNAESPVFAARLHDGARPISQPVELVLDPRELRIGAKAISRGELRVSPRAGGADRFISLPDGSELQVADGSWLDALPGVEPGAPAVAWLEQRLWVALASLTCMIALAAWFWFFGLSLAAMHAARHVPFSLERKLGEQSLRELEQAEWFVETELEPASTREITERFQRLVAKLPKDGYRYRLEFRHAGVGPNAFALPGGIVLVTDELVGLCTLDEVTAVLAHELGHAHSRHVMQGILGGAGLEAALGAVFGDVSSSGIDVVQVPSLLLELGYSRELEQQADDAAYVLLRQLQLAPALLGDALERMQRYEQIGWLAAHDAPVDDVGASVVEGEGDGAAGAGGAAIAEPEDAELAGESSPSTSGSENWVELAKPADVAGEGGSGGRGQEDESDAPVADARFAGLDVPEMGEPDEPEEEGPWSFLSTHPVTAERIARARAAR